MMVPVIVVCVFECLSKFDVGNDFMVFNGLVVCLRLDISGNVS